MSTRKKRVQGETLEPAPAANRLPQLNIVGGAATAAAGNAGTSAPRAAAPRIVEIAADGSFELPPDEPPTLDDADEPPALFDIAGQAAAATAAATAAAAAASAPGAAPAPSVMDEMLEAANSARKVVKDKAVAEEARVKKDFGSGIKKGFFDTPAAKKPDPAVPRARRDVLQAVADTHGLFAST